MKAIYAIALGLLILGQEVRAQKPEPVEAIKLATCPETALLVSSQIEDTVRPKLTKGDTLVFKAPAGTVKLLVTEVPRNTRIEDELRAIIGALKPSAAAGAPPCFSYTLTQRRAKLAVVAKSFDDKDLAARSVTTGPTEHLYATIDAPVTNIKQLKYDEATKKLVEREKPASIYVGLNYRVGDVFDSYETWDVNNFSFKLLMRPTSKPSESFGFGIGYSFEFADVFVARLRTKTESDVAGAKVETKDSTAVGISFDVGKAIGWLKK